MGNVYLVRRNWHRGFEKKPVETLIKGSEYLGADDDAINFVNGNIGIFFYERDLWYPEELKERLIKIVQAIDTLDLPEYWDVDGQMKKPKRGKKGKIVMKYE